MKNSKPPKREKIRVLIADDDTQMARSLTNMLIDHDFDARFTTNGRDALEITQMWVPRIVLADLMLPDINALELIQRIANDGSLKDQVVDVCILSGHNSEENVRQAFAVGAKDYIVKPITATDLLSRLVLHCRKHRVVKKFDTTQPGTMESAAYWIHIMDLMLTQAASTADINEKLFNLTRMATVKVGGNRCSIVHFVGQNQGVVVTSQDDRTASGIILDLNKYPEIQLVANTRSMLAVENLDHNRQFGKIKDNLDKFTFNALVVCPVFFHDELFGVLSMRMPDTKSALSDPEIQFIEIVSKMITLSLSAEPPSWIASWTPMAA